MFLGLLLPEQFRIETVMMLLCDQETAIAMNKYVGSRSNIEIVVPNDLRSYFYREISMQHNCMTTVLTDTIDIAEMCNDSCSTPVSYPDPDQHDAHGVLRIELLFEVRTYESETKLKKFVSVTDSVVEAAWCSDKTCNVVWVSPRDLDNDDMKRQFMIP